MVLDGGNKKADNEYQDAAMELLDLLASMALKLVATATRLPVRKQDWKHRRALLGPDGKVHGHVNLHKSRSKTLRSLDPASKQRLVRQEVDGKHLWLLDDRRNARPGRVQQAVVLTDEQAVAWMKQNGYTVVHGAEDPQHPTTHEAKAGEHLVVIGGHTRIVGPERGQRPVVAATDAEVVLDSSVRWKDLGQARAARIEVADDGREEVVQIDTAAEDAQIRAAQEQARREQEQRDAEQQAETEHEHGPRVGMVAPALLAAGAAAAAGAAMEAAGPDPIGVDPGAAIATTTTTTTPTTN